MLFVFLYDRTNLSHLSNNVCSNTDKGANCSFHRTKTCAVYLFLSSYSTHFETAMKLACFDGRDISTYE